MTNAGISGFLIAVSIAVCAAPAVHAKVWTIDQRQAKLMQDINAAQKSKAIDAKTAGKLRGVLADVARSKKKMMSKHNGKLTPEDTAKLQEKIDGASAEIKEKANEIKDGKK